MIKNNEWGVDIMEAAYHTKNETNVRGGRYHGSSIEGEPSRWTAIIALARVGRLGTRNEYRRSSKQQINDYNYNNNWNLG